MGHEFKDKDLTEIAIGSAMTVHRKMGNGFNDVWK
jgi:hypothetical protein